MRCLPGPAVAKDQSHPDRIAPNARSLLAARTAAALLRLNALGVLALVNGVEHLKSKIKPANQKRRPGLPLAPPEKAIHPPIPSVRCRLQAGKGLRQARLKLQAHHRPPARRQPPATHPRPLATHQRSAPALLGLVQHQGKGPPIRNGVLILRRPLRQPLARRCLPRPRRPQSLVNRTLQNGLKAAIGLGSQANLKDRDAQDSLANPKAANGLDSLHNLKVANDQDSLVNLRAAIDQDSLTDVDGLDNLCKVKVANGLNAPPPRNLRRRRLPRCLQMSPSVTAKLTLNRRGRLKTRPMPSVCS